MRSTSATTGVFLSQALARQAKAYAVSHGVYLHTVVEACARRLVAHPPDKIPDCPPEPRNKTTMVLCTRDTMKQIKLMAVQRDTSVREAMHYAVSEGLKAAAKGEVLITHDLTGMTRSPALRFHVSPELRAQIDGLAASMGTTTAALAESLLAWAVATPHAMSLVLGSSRPFVPGGAAPTSVPPPEPHKPRGNTRRKPSRRKTRSRRPSLYA
jgi:predicted transcriptional regulator